ncbi:leucine-rich repeat domain-containing protein, partial [Xanthovirga aplysinae]|uniref:leucine-rich repeat domain-containing protein n=1 Tax=Xanthovirga aplysinae TaxID=2529853 RepID=UPI001656EB17
QKEKIAPGINQQEAKFYKFEFEGIQNVNTVLEHPSTLIEGEPMLSGAIRIVLPKGTDNLHLTPKVDNLISDLYTISPALGETVDFSNNRTVEYTITSVENPEIEVQYLVQVFVEKGPEFVDFSNVRFTDAFGFQEGFEMVAVQHPQIKSGMQVGKGEIAMEFAGSGNLVFTPKMEGFNKDEFTVSPTLGEPVDFSKGPVEFTITSKLNPNLSVHYWVGLSLEVVSDKAAIFSIYHANKSAIDAKLGDKLDTNKPLEEILIDLGLTSAMGPDKKSYKIEEGRLIHLDLSAFDIHSLPIEISYLTALTYLDLGYNKLTSLPPELSTLTKLETLLLDRNEQLGTIPSEIGNLASLTALDIGNTATETLPKEVGALKKLKFLWISSTVNCLPQEIWDLSNLWVYIEDSPTRIYGNSDLDCEE